MILEKKIGSVERALKILDCFTHEPPSMSLTDIASQTGFYKSTILRLTESLVTYGYLIRDKDKMYRLGPSIGRLGTVYQSVSSIELEIMPFLQELSEKTKESSSYFVLRGDRRVCLLQVNSKHRIRLHLEQGEELSLDGGASARLLRAYNGDNWEGYVGVKERGWAISVGERDPEVASVAVALLGQTDKFYGALVVSGPVLRFNDEKRQEALKLLINVCNQLRSRLI